MRSVQVTCLALVSAFAALGACASPSGETEEGPVVGITPAGVDPKGGNYTAGPNGAPEPGEAPMLGMHRAKDAAPSGGTVASPLMTSHGGVVMSSSVVTAIFWGTSWSSASFVGDKIDGLSRLYSRLSTATSYVASNTEYTGTNGKVGTAITYAGANVDKSAAPSHAPKTSAILAEVCKRITTPVANGYYPVYTDTKRGGAGYCAWHSYGTCGTTPVQFAFFFNLDGDSGCDPKDTVTAHSQGLAALANVTGHEWSEMMTDPRNGGWWDSAGNENGDKCAWTWPSTLPTTSSTDPTTGVTTTESWKIQGNWSNAAFTAGTGYMNASKQLGCLPN